MPVLPDDRALGGRNVPSSGRGITSVRTGQVAQAVEGFGNAVVNTGNVVFAEQDKRKQFEAKKAFMQFQSEQEEFFEDQKKTVEPGAFGFQDQYAVHYRGAAKKFLETIPANLKQEYDLRLFETESAFGKAARSFEGQEAIKYYDSETNTGLDTIGQRLIADPANLDKYIADGNALIDVIPDDAKSQQEKIDLKKAWAERASLLSIDRKFHDDPEFASVIANSGVTDAKSLIKNKEGFSSAPYDDGATDRQGTRVGPPVYRAGYGSDTYTTADGKVHKVTKTSVVTREDAERDIDRRIGEFQKQAIGEVGPSDWKKLPANIQAVVTSITYNYGEVPARIRDELRSGDPKAIAEAIRGLKGDNGGINAKRREQEALIVMSSASIGASAEALGIAEGSLSPEAMIKIEAMAEKAVADTAATKKAEEDALKEQAFAFVESGGDPDALPYNIRIGLGRAEMAGLISYAKSKKEKGEPETDDRVFYELQTKYAEDPAAFAELNLFDYRDKLSDADWDKVNGFRQTAITDRRKAKEEGAKLSTAFSSANTALEAVGISEKGTKGEKREAVMQRKAQFQNALSGQIEEFRAANGKTPNDVEIQTMVNKLLLPIVIEEPGMFWGTNQTEGKFLFEAGTIADDQTVDVVVEYETIPVHIRRAIATDLEDQLGRKPSEEEIVQMYEEFVLGS